MTTRENHPLYQFFLQAKKEAEKAGAKLDAMTTKCPLRIKAKQAEICRRLWDAEERAERDWQEWLERHPDSK